MVKRQENAILNYVHLTGTRAISNELPRQQFRLWLWVRGNSPPPYIRGDCRVKAGMAKPQSGLVVMRLKCSVPTGRGFRCRVVGQ